MTARALLHHPIGCGICHSRCWSNTWHLWRICRSFGLNFYWIWGSRLSNQSGKSWCGNHPWKWPIPQLHQEPRSATVKAFVMLIPIAILSLFVADPATWKSSLVCKMARRKLKQWEEMRRQHHDLWLMTCDIGDGNMQTGRQTADIHRNVTIYICRWNDWVLIGLNFNWIIDQFNLWVILYTNIPHPCAAAKNLHHWWGRVSTCRRLEWMCNTLQSMPAPECLGWSWCDFGFAMFFHRCITGIACLYDSTPHQFNRILCISITLCMHI